MAAPNLNAPTKVEGKVATQAVGTSATAIVTNAPASGKAIRVVSLWVANVDGVSAASVSVDVYDGSTARHILKLVDVPADSTLEVIGPRPLYLDEGKSLRLTAAVSGDIEAVCAYEEVS